MLAPRTFSAVVLALTAAATAAASNATNISNALAHDGAPHADASASPTIYIKRCDYDLISKSKTWPGGDAVCDSSTQNSCIEVPNMPVGLCQWGGYTLGSYRSRKIVHNTTHFWSVFYQDAPPRTKHCQDGTEIPPDQVPSKFSVFPHGTFATCEAVYPGDGTLNPKWQEPSNFCSTHRYEISDTRDAHSCVGGGIHTQKGKIECKDANEYEKSIKTICGGSRWDLNPRCGCFRGYMYFV
jgi:hypothetical protein